MRLRVFASAMAGMVLTIVVAAPAARQPSSVDPRLEQAIAWYTGTSGRVDDDRAHALLQEALKGGDAVSRCGSHGATHAAACGSSTTRCARTRLPRR